MFQRAGAAKQKFYFVSPTEGQKHLEKGSSANNMTNTTKDFIGGNHHFELHPEIYWEPKQLMNNHVTWT